jgi:hypothetical protein
MYDFAADPTNSMTALRAQLVDYTLRPDPA